MTRDDASFPRRSAATRRFTLGRPRSFAVAPDGSRAAFLRSPAGDDPTNSLWVFDVAEGRERLVADGKALLAGDDEDLPQAERTRRERTREQAGGIVAFAADGAMRTAAFALGGRLFVADLVEGGARELPARGPVFDPRPDPSGRRVAYVNERALRVCDVDGEDREVVGEAEPNVSWGQAEFVAAEEMGRSRGFWWSPDGSMLLVARVDESPVQIWHIADPAEPSRPPRVVRYPAAGTANADVSLWLIGLDGVRTEVTWDRPALPYLVAVAWSEGHPPQVVVESRDQRRMVVLEVDPSTGATTVVREDIDPVWLDIVPGVPAWTSDGRLVWTADLEDTRRLLLDGEPATPAGLQVRRVVDAGDGVVFVGSEEATVEHGYRLSPDGAIERLTREAGVHEAEAGGDVVVIASSTMDSSAIFTIHRIGEGPIASLASFAESPPIVPKVRFLRAGSRELWTAVLLPTGHREGDGPYPVLMDPYGGPHAQRVTASRDDYLQSQWLADQGFAVVVADGRGTPARGPAWERSVHLDLATFALEDQVDALYAVHEQMPGVLDLSRVGIRGWSFGGYLSALAVLRRPDVFRAAVAGAPVTDWRLYDTHYTERYLGHPDEEPDAYERSSLLRDAKDLTRPLMIIHGLADDNVVVAHSLGLSRALLEAGRPHTVLPLSGVTHMTPQEVVAENLLLLQVAFLKDALGITEPG
jgi:dipeptidyl-peptidase-4